MTLEERVADFIRAFPHKKTSSTTLGRIYKQHNIRKKKIKITKITNRKERRKITRSIAEAKHDLQLYRTRGFRIIYLDETMVTKSTMATQEWSQKYHNYEIDMKDYARETVAVLAGISKEYGLDYISTFDRSVNIPKFKEFIQNLRDKFFFEDICIYMDNLSVHRSKAVKERLDEMSILYVFGPPYSPDYNPIESVFSIAKKELKTRRLEAVLKKR